VQLRLNEATIDQLVTNLLLELKTRAKPSVLFFFAGLEEYIALNHILLKQGCDLEQRDMNGQTALFYSCYFKSLDAMLLLLEHGADHNTTDNKGNTPLMQICSVDPDLAKVNHFLALPNIDVNARNNEGKTALHKTVQENYPLVIAALLKHPAIDINLRTHKGFSALDYAINHQHFDNLQRLLCHPNIDTRASNYPIVSVLYFAIEHRLLSVIKQLVHDEDCGTHPAAFNYAIWRRQDDIATLFLQNMNEQNQRIFLQQAAEFAWKKGQRDLELRLHEKYGKQYGLFLYPRKIKEPIWGLEDAEMQTLWEIADLLSKEHSPEENFFAEDSSGED
jgi:ankyrin repeat protein